MNDLSKSPDRIAGMFDAIASRYDLLNHLLSGGIDRRWRARAIESLGLTGRERVLDLCTGTGDVALVAVRSRPAAARVVGVDFSGAMLAVAAEKIEKARQHDRVTLVRGDATRIPLADRSVNAVTIAFGIRNVQDATAACREIRRVLAVDGRLAVLEFAVPTAPGMSRLYMWYVRRILPVIGRAISRHGTAYEYLPTSIGAFFTPAEFVKILRHAGFIDISAVPLTFGSVILYTATRGLGDWGLGTGD